MQIITTVEERIVLTKREKEAATLLQDIFPLKVSAHYLRLLDPADVNDPLRKIVIPSLQELDHRDGEEDDDVHEDEARYQPCSGIIHRYPGKLLFIPTLRCASHCRFCFRKGHKVEDLSDSEGIEALNYIRNNRSIRDVVVTGGDPLSLDDRQLEYYLSSIRACSHVEIIRITTRWPIYSPARVTDEFIAMVAKFRPMIMIFSFMHPRELAPETEDMLKRLADAGIMMLQQGPILRGINDDPKILIELYEKLVRLQVLPYYATWGISAPGTEHFMLDGKRASEIIHAMENNTSGFCIPHLSTIAKGTKVRTIGYTPDMEQVS